MAAKITFRFIELTYEAALKSYWRKEALRKFLRASHVAESFLATWGSDESKRDFLDKTFQKLQGTDRGKAVIFQMARSLSEPGSTHRVPFPGLANTISYRSHGSDGTRAYPTKMVQHGGLSPILCGQLGQSVRRLGLADLRSVAATGIVSLCQPRYIWKPRSSAI